MMNVSYGGACVAPSCKQPLHRHFWECQGNEFRLCRNEAQTMLAGLCAVIKTSVSREYTVVLYSNLLVSMYILVCTWLLTSALCVL